MHRVLQTTIMLGTT